METMTVSLVMWYLLGAFVTSMLLGFDTTLEDGAWWIGLIWPITLPFVLVSLGFQGGRWMAERLAQRRRAREAKGR